MEADDCSTGTPSLWKILSLVLDPSKDNGS